MGLFDNRCETAECKAKEPVPKPTPTPAPARTLLEEIADVRGEMNKTCDEKYKWRDAAISAALEGRNEIHINGVEEGCNRYFRSQIDKIRAESSYVYGVGYSVTFRWDNIDKAQTTWEKSLREAKQIGHKNQLERCRASQITIWKNKILKDAKGGKNSTRLIAESECREVQDELHKIIQNMGVVMSGEYAQY
jgi:hypothetical protein